MTFRNTAARQTTKTRWAASAALAVLTSLSWAQEAEEPPPVVEVEPPNPAMIEAAEDFGLLDIDPELLEQLANALGDDIGIDAEMDFAAFQGMAALPGRRRLLTPLSPGTLKTDGDAEMLLERAEAFGKQGRYDLASRLWQQAIDQSSDSLLARPDWKQTTYAGHTYRQMRPMLAEIEASMKRTIGEGLADYQLKIDGDARALLARSTPESRETALADIVLRYFLSSVGDDSAFELGCLKMERGEFLPAVRLFSKILDEYPNSNLDLVAVEIRLAGSLARVGSAAQALDMVAALHEKHPEWRRILTLVKQDIEEVREALGGSQITDATLQTPLQIQSNLPGTLPEILEVDWKQRFDLTLPQAWPVLPESPRSPLPTIVNQFQNAQFQNRQRLRAGQANVKPAAPKPLRMEDRWREFFMPAGQVIVREGTAFFKTDDRLVACDTSSGSLKWLGFRNSLALAESTTQSTTRIRNQSMQTLPFPTNAEELLLFGDRVNQSMTLADDRIYVLQGNPLDFQDEKPEVPEIQPNRRNQFNMNRRSLPGRFRENRLVAYDATSGKLQWYRRSDEPLDPNLPIVQRSGFASSPVPYGNLLLVPVHVETSLWLVGLDQQTGETVWRTFLCDEPPGQCEGLSPVPISVDAGDAYVGSGAGLLFSVDAISGQLNWAVNYPRTEIPLTQESGLMMSSNDRWKLLDGLKEDRVLPHGNEVIVVGGDFNFLFAVNRRTGELSWEAAQTPFRGPDSAAYALAVHEGRFYVSGERSVRCYQTSGGRLLWETVLPEVSHARGAFTPAAIYIPLKAGIVQLDPKDGRLVARSRVTLANEDEPIGNLFTDGERLIVFGLKQVYGLSPVTTSNESLN